MAAGLVRALEKGDVVAVSRTLRDCRQPLINPGIRPLLHVAVEAPANCWLMVGMLLEKGVPINTADLAGATALHIAADKGHVKCVQQLLQMGSKVNKGDKDGRIPLHYAARNHNSKAIKCLQLLIEAGSQVDSPTRHSYTPLHVAAEIGNATAVNMLIKARAKVDVSDDKGCTPLHMASTPGVAKLLLDAGANSRAVCGDKKNVFQKAIKHRPSFMKHLLDAGIAVQGNLHDCELKVYFHFDHIKGQAIEVGILQEVADCKLYDILKHPLCETFLHLKWIRVCLLFYIKATVFINLLVALTASACIRFSCSQHGEHRSHWSATFPYISHADGVKYLNTYAKLMLAVLLFTSVTQLVILRTYFVRQMRKVTEILLAVTCLVLLIHDSGMGEWECHVWAITLLVGWYHVVVLIGHTPSLGIYVHMFKKVSVRMLTFAGVYSSLFIGFVVSFYLVFDKNPFGKLWTSGLKTLAMMVGELDFSSIFDDNSAGVLTGTAQVVFVLFVLLMTVVITNLLVGLAVQDIQMLHKEAGVSRLALTVEQETSVDIMLSSRLISFIMPRQLHTWLQNKCSLLYHFPPKDLHVQNACNQTSDTSVDWWIRSGSRSQQRGPMKFYNIFICPYNPKTPGRVYISNDTKMIPTSYILPEWIVRNTKLLIENGLHNNSSDVDLIPDEGDEEVEENEMTGEERGITLENLQEQLNELQKSVMVMSQMLKKSMNSK